MGKNMKKVLSYALGIVLALGVGFTYAYAVGANDSNAFVTRTEWQAKVDQVEASIDNVTKTLNQNTMDFMMNGPRLRVGFADGFENNGGMSATGGPGGMAYRETTLASITSRFMRTNHMYLLDNWDGSQMVSNYEYTSSDSIAGAQYPIIARFALKVDNEEDTYIVVSITGYLDLSVTNPYMGLFDRVKLGDGPPDYSSAQTLTVTLPLSDWGPMSGTAFTAQGRTSSAVYTGTQANSAFSAMTRMYSNNNSAEALSNPGTGYIRRDLTATDVSFTWEFPATACTIKQFNTSSPYCVYNAFPKNMAGRKFGGPYDRLNLSNSSVTSASVYKVYSPQKGCLALKSYLVGEIPILNE